MIGGDVHPISQQPLHYSCPIQRHAIHCRDHFQPLLKLQDSIPTSHKVIPYLPPSNLKNTANYTRGISSPSISTDTTPILVQRTTSSPAGDSSPIFIKVTTQSYRSLVLYTIPPIEISTKFPQVGELHPRSPPPPQLFWSNEARKRRRMDCL